MIMMSSKNIIQTIFGVALCLSLWASQKVTNISTLVELDWKRMHSCGIEVRAARVPRRASTLVDFSDDFIQEYNHKTLKMIDNFSRADRSFLITSKIDEKAGVQLEWLEGGLAYFNYHERHGPLGIVPASAWNDSVTVLSDPSRPPVFVAANEDMLNASVGWTTTEVQGDHVVYNTWFMGNFGHTLHDLLPIIAWLRENLPSHFRFVLPREKTTMAIFRAVDPAFARTRVVWISLTREKLVVRNGRLVVLHTPTPMRASVTNKSLKKWVGTLPKTHRFERKTILYYSRGGSKDTEHGRVVEQQHEADILNLIQSKMNKYGLSKDHTLIVYNGQAPNGGGTMSIEDQKNLFSLASAVIGPHGSGLANILWMTTGDNGKRPQVLEFLLGPMSTQVQNASQPFMKSYYDLYGAPDWLEYWHILYAPNSTSSTTFVNLDAFGLALDRMWGCCSESSSMHVCP